MANELAKFAEWTFFQEVQPTKDVMDMLLQGEQVYAAFKTIRDIAVFTSYRLIVRDSQGLTGSKIETYSLPWKSVDMWSIENAGMLDFNSEVELWTRAGHVKINLKKGADVNRINGLLTAFILGAR
ncbi:MAG: PH domain-containing protein [Eggerthellaceae bacterium]|nr:PH domain-containing protein [Eggerthellaceae bacterium]